MRMGMLLYVKKAGAECMHSAMSHMFKSRLMHILCARVFNGVGTRALPKFRLYLHGATLFWHDESGKALLDYGEMHVDGRSRQTGGRTSTAGR